MPTISAADHHLTVINLFSTDAPEKQDKLIGAMREIVDSAAFPGWISSTVHSAQGNNPGTANFIQWRSGEDLEARYAGEEFKHRTLPLFTEITTSIKLLQTEAVFTQRHPRLGDNLEISPDRDDYTVIELIGVAAEDQDELVDALGPSRTWLLDVPGYRSHAVLRGLAARGVEGAFVVVYSQWDDQESYDAFLSVPQQAEPVERQKSESRVDALATTREMNTYRVVHTRASAA
jgi:heme-degrading monooxygenase HmoA